MSNNGKVFQSAWRIPPISQLTGVLSSIEQLMVITFNINYLTGVGGEGADTVADVRAVGECDDDAAARVAPPRGAREGAGATSGAAGAGVSRTGARQVCGQTQLERLCAATRHGAWERGSGAGQPGGTHTQGLGASTGGLYSRRNKAPAC